MNRCLFAALPLCLLVASPVLAQSKASQVSKKFGWLDNLAVGKAQARQADKPLMVVFRCDP